MPSLGTLDKKCYRCGNSGHLARSCPSSVYLCFRCHRPGHILRECPSMICFACKQAGHISRNCPVTSGNHQIHLNPGRAGNAAHRSRRNPRRTGPRRQTPKESKGHQSSTPTPATATANGDLDSQHNSPSGGGVDANSGDEARHNAAIAESRRKIAELNQYDAERRQKEKEERERREAIDASRRKLAEMKRMETAQHLKELAEKERRRKEEAAARERAAREAEEKRSKAKAERDARRMREDPEWQAACRAEYITKQREALGFVRSSVWNSKQALDRYVRLSDAFDSAKFGPGPGCIIPSFRSLPWPVLRSPALLTLEDVDWAG